MKTNPAADPCETCGGGELYRSGDPSERPHPCEDCGGVGTRVVHCDGCGRERPIHGTCDRCGIEACEDCYRRWDFEVCPVCAGDPLARVSDLRADPVSAVVRDAAAGDWLARSVLRRRLEQLLALHSGRACDDAEDRRELADALVTAFAGGALGAPGPSPAADATGEGSSSSYRDKEAAPWTRVR